MRRQLHCRFMQALLCMACISSEPRRCGDHHGISLTLHLSTAHRYASAEFHSRTLLSLACTQRFCLYLTGVVQLLPPEHCTADVLIPGAATGAAPDRCPQMLER